MTAQNPIFIPGPTNIPDRLRQAMNAQTADHRAPDFVDLLQPLLTDLKRVFKTTTGQVVTFPASGTGGWEAAIANTLSPGDKVLVARFGMFSHRWIDLCQRHKLDVEIIECEWGTGAPADLYEERLAADKDHTIKAVLVTHNETATGVRSDIAAVRRA
ncbi:MAG: aminotransferase class V-fold PLP-dependent enzyme, partial [Pseudomonadota bacterium]